MNKLQRLQKLETSRQERQRLQEQRIQGNAGALALLAEKLEKIRRNMAGQPIDPKNLSMAEKMALDDFSSDVERDQFVNQVKQMISDEVNRSKFQ